MDRLMQHPIEYDPERDQTFMLNPNGSDQLMRPLCEVCHARYTSIVPLKNPLRWQRVCDECQMRRMA